MTTEEDTIEPTEELEEEEETLTFEDLKSRLYGFVYNQPTVMLSILEVAFDFLIDKGIMTREEMEAIMREGLRRWMER